MFAKTYKIKSNNTLKNSEKKHLAQRIQGELPLATEDKAKELVPVKSICSCMKLTLHNEETFGVYVVDGFPTIIELATGLVPTVCALWKVPDLLPMLTIHPDVLSKVAGGAALYVPGVLAAADGGITAPFAAQAVVGVRTSDNVAAALVGRATISSADLLVRASGVCLEPINVYRDQLCKDPKFNKIERPLRGPVLPASSDGLADTLRQLSIQNPIKEEWPSLGKQVSSKPIQNEPRIIPEEPPVESMVNNEPAAPSDLKNSVMEESQESEESIPSDMDGLLQWCLLSFIKVHGKSVELPLKTNLLYKNYLMPFCPSDRSLDVKKSSYKKMSKFLEAMQQEGLVEVREVEKGVDALVALNAAHPRVRAHRAPADLLGLAAPVPRADGYEPPRVREMYCVTAAVLDLFAPLKKGTALPASEIRSVITEYVRTRDLSQKKGCVVLDSLLAKILNKPEQEIVKWEEVMSAVQGKMTASTEMQFPDGTVKLMKSKLDPVRMQVATRSGNKKVTLVSNLETFGFHLASMAAACQAGVAASCGVTRSPGSATDQLMLQGDQTHYMAKLLIEKYGLPKKFVEGADKALKKKK